MGTSDFSISVDVDVDYLQMAKDIAKESRKRVKASMKEVERKAKSAVVVKTGALKDSIDSGVKNKKGLVLGWCSAGKKGLRYAVVEESRRPYMRTSFDRVVGNKEDTENKILDGIGAKD